MTTLCLFASDVEHDLLRGATVDTPGEPRFGVARDVDHDLALLAVHIAGAGGVVVVEPAPGPGGADEALAAVADHLDRLAAVGVAKARVVAVDRDRPDAADALWRALGRLGGADVDHLRPWGWSPRIARLLAPLAPPGALQPRVDAARRLGDKRATVALRSALWLAARADIDDDEAFELAGAVIDDLDGLRARWAKSEAAGHDLFVKAPFGGSGRDALRLLAGRGEPTTGQVGWLDRTLREQGSLIVERKMDRRSDFGLLRDDDGRWLAMHRAFCDGRGGFRGVALPGTHSDAERARASVIAPSLREAVDRATAAAGHVGACGVDLVLRRDGGPWPVEINARTTIGHVGHRLAPLLAPGHVGRLLVLSVTDKRSSRVDTFSRLMRRLTIGLPLDHRRDGPDAGLRSGAVALAPPALARRALPVLCVAKDEASLDDGLLTALGDSDATRHLLVVHHRT